MDSQKKKELEARIADLKARLPAHPVKSAMLLELEEAPFKKIRPSQFANHVAFGI